MQVGRHVPSISHLTHFGKTRIAVGMLTHLKHLLPSVRHLAFSLTSVIYWHELLNSNVRKVSLVKILPPQLFTDVVEILEAVWH